MKRSVTITFFGLAVATFVCHESYDSGYSDGRESLRDSIEVRSEETELANGHMVEQILRADIEDLEKKLAEREAVIKRYRLGSMTVGK